jgi:hypothetical protein
MEPQEKPAASRTVKWVRIVLLLGFALLIFYLGINFRVTVIPDDYVVMHPFILPGQHWVYRRSHAFFESLNPGDLVMFAYDAGTEEAGRHISMLIGFPGQKLEYMPDRRNFRVDGTNLELDCPLGSAWDDAGYELMTLGADEFLLIDINRFEDSPRFWLVKRQKMAGKFLFQLPF